MSQDGEHSGGSVSYYQIPIDHPTTPGRDPYTAECNDIIEALDMSFAEANVFKAVWRSAAARQGKRKAGYDGGKYDAEKVVFYGQRMLARIEACPRALAFKPGESVELTKAEAMAIKGLLNSGWSADEALAKVKAGLDQPKDEIFSK